MPTPKVFMIGQTMIDLDALVTYLRAIGVSEDTIREFGEKAMTIKSDLDLLVEVEGRLCYKSWEVGLNRNVTRIRENTAEYLSNLIESGHGSVLEHTTINFIVTGGSRVFTHELVRHRAGTAFSQESMRYVRLDRSISVRDTPYISDKHRLILDDAVDNLMAKVELIEEEMNMDSLSFDKKKKITSDLRSFVPMGVLTEIGFSANVRALRHMIEARTAPGAEHEIREIFSQVALLCIEAAPHLFADFECKEGSWIPLYSKV